MPNHRCNLLIAESPIDLARQAAALIADAIQQKPDLVIIPATGNTPLATYRELATLRAERHVDTSRLRIFQLDDYLHIPPTDPRSLFAWMQRSFLDPLQIEPHQVVRFGNESTACRDYDLALAQAGGADLAILGLGPNGHLGYNEPPSDQHAPTRIVALTPASLQSSTAYFSGPVPTQGITAGMPALLSAKKILLLVSGKNKQAILHQTLHGPITPNLPASYLQQCPQATVIADRDAIAREHASP